MRKSALILLFLLIAAGVVFAQDEVGESQREIYTVLDIGDPVFEPELWYVSATESASRTTATFTADSLGGLAFIDYLHFDGGFNPEDVETVFGQEWFDTTLYNYAVWRQNTFCDLGDVRLYEFSLQNADIKYGMRYWIEQISPTRVLTMFIVFPIDTEGALEDYAERLYPDAYSCSGSVG